LPVDDSAGSPAPASPQRSRTSITGDTGPLPRGPAGGTAADRPHDGAAPEGRYGSAWPGRCGTRWPPQALLSLPRV